MIIALQIIGGFLLLLGGAEIMVRGAVALARRFGISALVIGMTVVALGTSAPELLVSLNAALSGAPGLAVGNVVGSNIANILLILGAAGLVTPIACAAAGLRRDGAILLAGTLIFSALSFRGVVDAWSGAVLLIAFSYFLWNSYKREAAGEGGTAGEAGDLGVPPANLLVAVLMFLAGLAALLAGSELVVRGGVAAARLFGVSDAVIGLTVVAVGTSLPELAASVVAAYRGHTDVALGNVVGSNMFNVLGVIGVVAVVTPVTVEARVVDFDIWIMIGATLLLLPFMMGGLRQIGRAPALAFLIMYVAYIGAIGLGVDRIPPA
ncbi:MAG: calcium/sodium antiporter [Rhodospirillales bacterium]|nr:calcium/sodium antiporter [Rhodospirillales bacterium]